MNFYLTYLIPFYLLLLTTIATTIIIPVLPKMENQVPVQTITIAFCQITATTVTTTTIIIITPLKVICSNLFWETK